MRSKKGIVNGYSTRMTFIDFILDIWDGHKDEKKKSRSQQNPGALLRALQSPRQSKMARSTPHSRKYLLSLFKYLYLSRLCTRTQGTSIKLFWNYLRPSLMTASTDITILSTISSLLNMQSVSSRTPNSRWSWRRCWRQRWRHQWRCRWKCRQRRLWRHQRWCWWRRWRRRRWRRRRRILVGNVPATSAHRVEFYRDSRLDPGHSCR